MKTVLGIGGHPDDLEIFCGGTLAKFSSQGWKVVMVSVCSGDKGVSSDRKGDIVLIRKKEAENSAKVIGADSIILGFSDSSIFPGEKLRNSLVELIRKIQPTLILTHFIEDYHADHRVVAEEVVNSAYISTSKGFKTDSEPLKIIPVVYYMDTFAGIGFIPTEYVDITETINTKIEMIKKHTSQFIHLKDRGGIDIIELVKDMAKFRGWQSGVKYAEGFRQVFFWPNLKTRRLLP